MVDRTLEIRPCASHAEELRSLEIWNAVFRRDALGEPEVASLRAQVAGWADIVAWLDGEAVGSLFTIVRHQRPDIAVAFLVVAEHARRRSVGSALYRTASVHREWRGRGIAGALKRTQLKWAKERGYASLQTENEVRNTPIRKLNERLGYRPVADRVFLAGPLASAGT